MRTIIAGSRSCSDMRQVRAAMEACGWRPTVILSGAARGADRLGECWAAEQGIPCERYPADWDRHGRSAGYRRNVQMASCANALVALWDGASRGTEHMIEHARQRGLRVYVHHIDPPATLQSCDARGGNAVA